MNAGLALLTDNVQPDAALLLVESEALLTEPSMTGVQTIMICSPQAKRYKEFVKKGAVKCFMPVWKLDELQLVAAHIREKTNDQFLKEALTPIPVHERVVPNAESEQEIALANAKAVDTFIRSADIEKRDDNKENISHFLLQYDVNEDTFVNYTMMIASEYVEKMLDSQSPNNTELHESIDELIHVSRR